MKYTHPWGMGLSKITSIDIKANILLGSRFPMALQTHTATRTRTADAIATVRLIN